VSKYDFDPLYHKAENFRTNKKHISITPPSFMKFCPIVPEICRGQVHVGIFTVVCRSFWRVDEIQNGVTMETEVPK
jgi:hypothetical protein